MGPLPILPILPILPQGLIVVPLIRGLHSARNRVLAAEKQLVNDGSGGNSEHLQLETANYLPGGHLADRLTPCFYSHAPRHVSCEAL